MMFEEFVHFGPKGEGRMIPFLIMISMFKDDIPWIYEIGLDTYRSLKTAKGSERTKLLSNFQSIVEHAMDHPMIGLKVGLENAP